MLKIWTVQISVAKKLALQLDHRYLDITVGSGNSVFAPTWEIVRGYKDKTINEATYTRKYIELMRESYQRSKNRWNELLAMEEVILACYCPAGSFCHRYILKDILVKCGGVYQAEIKEEGGMNECKTQS